MSITEQEAGALRNLASHAVTSMAESGAHCCLLLWTTEQDGKWMMEWHRAGSPHEAIALANRYGVMDAQASLATAIANQMNKPDDGDKWKENPP